MSGYKCPRCKAIRQSTTTTRSRDGSVVKILVVYECGTHYEIEKTGYVYKPKSFEYKCLLTR